MFASASRLTVSIPTRPQAAVQKSLRNTLGYLKAVKQIEAEMNKDPQSDVRTFVQVFAFDKIRADLNTVRYDHKHARGARSRLDELGWELLCQIPTGTGGWASGRTNERMNKPVSE